MVGEADLAKAKFKECTPLPVVELLQAPSVVDEDDNAGRSREWSGRGSKGIAGVERGGVGGGGHGAGESSGRKCKVMYIYSYSAGSGP